jgi:hypothetical protein
MLNPSILVVFQGLKNYSFVVFFSCQLEGFDNFHLYHLFPEQIKEQDSSSLDSLLLDLVYLMPFISYLLNLVQCICKLLLVVDYI